MKTFTPKFSFIIPVRNESARIDACLRSIRSQDYPAELVEILVPDQASEDDTRERARSYGARVTKNPAQRAIFSMPRAFEQVQGDLIVTMAADNRVHPQFCKRMTEVFQNPDVAMALPFVTTDRPDYATAVRYINRFTDPFNHFVYGDASNPRDLGRVYTPVLRGRGYSIYRFPAEFPPLLAIAQAAVLRAPFRMPEGYADDVAVVFDLLRSGKLIACVEAALVDHYTATGLWDVLRKFRRIIAKNFKPASSLRWRDQYLSQGRIVRRCIWPFYAISILSPLAVGVYRALRDREPLWLYHPVMTYAFMWIALTEALRNIPDALDLLLHRNAPIEPGRVSKE
ncbi:MAG TPA: glycosyltransferase family 2 protein [Candidatus Acidoferrales bacterium]|nr:glycosyltransferase family 2 protein [Candidatus Acidoferrales bacterium]